MNTADLVAALRDPAVLGALKKELGLPDEPVAAALREIAEAHARLERRVEQLALAIERLTEAQARTEQQLARFEQRVDERFAKVDERFAKVDERFAELAQAIAQLARRTDERFAELAGVMADLGRKFDQVVTGLGNLRGEVGTLSHAVGTWLEDAMALDLPRWLRRVHGISVGDVEPEWLGPADRAEEVDGVGRGTDGAGPVTVLCESKSRVHVRDVADFAAKLARLRPGIEARVLGVLIGHGVHPAARRQAAEAGLLIASVRELRLPASDAA